MVFSAHRSTQMHHLLQLAAIVIALLMLFCLQLSFGSGAHHYPSGDHVKPPTVDPPKKG
ncbi:hypothetical protein SETIT_3G314200v2 [Setaria italica]|uniref:Uncharacterized protein n=1 Tax=Setaria italica TaxID=4555 RepID=K3ZBP3_SETIT|nr:hypothetical protein SETIT_3G314200v2 [Setaria italica]